MSKEEPTINLENPSKKEKRFSLFMGPTRSASNVDKNAKAGEVAKQTKAWTPDTNVAVEQFRVAYADEARQHAATKAELAELKAKHEAQIKLYEEEVKQKAKLKKDLETLSAVLSNAPEQVQAVAKENEKLRADLKDAQHHYRKAKKGKKKLKEQIAHDKAEFEEHKKKADERYSQMLSEKTRFEKRCAQLQLAKLDQRFAGKTLAQVESEAREIFHKSLELVAVHKDLPRLYKAIDITDMDSNIIYQPDAKESAELNIKRALVNGTKRLDGEELSRRVDEQYSQFVEPGKDLIKGLGKVLVEIVTDKSRFAAALKAANQSIIAPVFGCVQDGLAQVLPFTADKATDVAGPAWKIAILFAPTAVRVTHRKREASTHESEELYGKFTFEWSVEFILTSDASEMTNMVVHLVGLKCEQAAKREQVRSLLANVFDRFRDPTTIHSPIHIATLDE